MKNNRGYTQSILPEIRAIPCLDQIAADDSTRSHHTPNGDLLLPEGKNSDSADHSFRGILPGEASTEEGADGSMTTSKSLSRRLSFLALMLIVASVNSTFSLMAPIFPKEAERRGIVPVVTGAIFAVYSFTNFFVSPFHGSIMQRRVMKRRSMLCMGVVLSALACLGLAVSVHIPVSNKALFSGVCLFLRVVNGIGAAAVDTSSMAICSELFKSSSNFGVLLGILESSLAVGWMVGPLIGGYLAVWGGFSAPFYAAAITGGVMIPVAFFMPDNQRETQSDAHEEEKMTHWTLLSYLEVSLLMLVTVLSAAAITFFDSILEPFLQDEAGFSSGTVGVCFAVSALAYAVMTFFAGWLSDRTSPVAVIIFGLLLCVIPFALMGPSPFLKPLLAGVMGTWHIWVSLVLLGAGCAMGLLPVLPAVLTTIDEERISQDGIEDLASGMVAAAYYLGGGTGPILGGTATALVGFEWACTLYGSGLLFLSSALAVTLLVTKSRQSRDKLSQPLLGDQL